MSTPQWNADIITPSISVDADVDIQTNGGLDKDASGALGVKVDNSTITINSAGALQANGGGSSYEFTDGLVESSGVVGIDMSVITSSSAGTFVTDEGQIGVNIDERTIVLDQDTEKLKVMNPLPEFTNYDDGKVLTVVLGSDEYVATWSPIPAELPAKSASDAGKALVVNSAGTGVEWASVGGGGGSSYTFTDGLVESSGVVSVDIGTAGLDMVYDEDLGKYVLGVKADDSTITVEEAVVKVLNPLPVSSASDAGKVLSVDSSGSAGWEASKSLAAGSGISITESSGVVTIAASGGGGGSGTVSTSNFIFGDGSSDAPLYVGVDGSSVSGKTALVKTYTREPKTSGGNVYYMGCSPLVYDEANEVFHLDSDRPIASWPGSYGSTANVLFYNHEDPTEYATCSVGIAATSGSAESSYVLGAWDTVTQNTISGDLQYWTYVGSGTLTLDKLKTFWCCLHIAGSTDPGNQGSPAGTYCISMSQSPGYAARVLTVTDSARVPAVTSGNTGKVLTVTGNSTFAWAAAPSATLSRNNVNMTLSSGKLTCSGITGGKGWYIGTLRIGMGSAPVTGPVTGTPVCIRGYTDSSFSSFCGSGSVINLEYYPVAEVQFMFYLGGSDTGIEELKILDSTGADVTATLATGVTSRLDYWKVSNT